MEPFEATLIKYTYRVPAGKWRQELGYRVVIELEGGEISLGDFADKLDTTRDLIVSVEAPLA